jgi:hypothetical protein
VLAWTDHWQGLLSGLMESFFWLPAFLVLVVPWCVAVLFLFQWKGRSRHRTAWALLAPGGFFVFLMVRLALQPQTDLRLFEDWAQTPLPASATNLRAYHEGGLKPSSVFSFSSSTSDVMALVAAMELTESSDTEPEDPLCRAAFDYRT